MVVTMEVLRPFVNISLFVAFFWFFGRNSVEKYLKGDVIISRNTDRTVDIIQPGKNYTNEVTRSITFHHNFTNIIYLQL